MVNLEQQETSIENNDLSIGEVALKFAKSINSGTNTRIKKARSKEFGIKNIETINVQTLTRNNPHMRMSNMSEDVKKSFYMVSLTNNTGSVLMAKQGKNIQPLAYFMDESDIDIQKVLTDSITDLSFIINSAIEETINAEEPMDAMFAQNNEIVEKVAPKCHVYWNQRYPYNKYCFTSKGEQALAGCVAIAGAQAMTVLQPNVPQISSWEEVTKTSPSSKSLDEIAKLVSYIGKEVGMKYGTNASGAKTNRLSKTFKNYGIKDYDAERAIDVLKTPHGVIVVSGYRAVHGWWLWKHNVDGHAFLADGYIKYREGKDPYFLHLNYGWGEGYNGKYKREVYLLSAKKKWKTEEAKNIYGRIYTHDIYYFSYARENEKNW